MKIKQLDKQIAEELSNSILDLEKFVNNVGGPDWTKENLLKDLPKKWDLSFLIMNDVKIIGYIIASDRNKCYHIHRPFLHPEYRGKLTLHLLRLAAKKAKEFDFNEISWKSGTRIIGFKASKRIADREEYIGNWDNCNFYYFYKKI